MALLTDAEAEEIRRGLADGMLGPVLMKWVRQLLEDRDERVRREREGSPRPDSARTVAASQGVASVMDERIEKAKRVLLADLRPIAEDVMGASVYVLTAGDTHEWVPIDEQLSVAGAADLLRDLIARDRSTQFQVSRGTIPVDARDGLLRKLSAALGERQVFVKPVEPQRS